MNVFDRAHFDVMTGGDRSLQLEVVALFRGQAGAMARALEGEAWREAVHTLKGSARGIGLAALAQACEDAELAGEAEGRTGLPYLRAALADALAALEQFAAAEV